MGIVLTFSPMRKRLDTEKRASHQGLLSEEDANTMEISQMLFSHMKENQVCSSLQGHGKYRSYRLAVVQ